MTGSRGGMRSFVPSWFLVGLSVLAFFGIWKVVGVLQTVEPVTMGFQGRTCVEAGVAPGEGGYCAISGKLTQSWNGDRWLIPAGHPDIRIHVRENAGYAYSGDGDSFPGGSAGMVIAWVASFLALAFPWIVSFAKWYRSRKKGGP